MKKLLAIAAYDLRWAANPVALLFAFALPLILALLIELAFGDLVLERGVPDMPVPVGIVNLDQGSRLGNFGAVLTSEIITEGISTAEATATVAAQGLLAEPRLRSQLRAGQLDAALADLARDALALEANPIQIAVEPAAGGQPRLALARQLAAAIAIFFAGFTGLLTSAVLMQERAQWTLQRTAATPTALWIILAGKTLSNYLKGLIQIAVLLGCIIAFEWLRRTTTSPTYQSANPPVAPDPVGLGLLALALVAATTGFGAAIATRARSYAQAINYGLGGLAVMGLIGGIFFPVSFFPPVLQVASRLTFHFWALDAYTRLALGAGAAAILPHLAVLTSMGLLTFGFGVWSLHRRTPFL